MNNQYYTFDEVLKITGLSKQRLYGLIKEGKIDAYRRELPKGTYFLKSEIDEKVAIKKVDQ